MTSWNEDKNRSNSADILSVIGDIFSRVAMVRAIEDELSAPEIDETRYELVHAEDLTLREVQEMTTLGESGHVQRELLYVQRLAERVNLDPQPRIFNSEEEALEYKYGSDLLDAS